MEEKCEGAAASGRAAVVTTVGALAWQQEWVEELWQGWQQRLEKEESRLLG